MPLGASPETIEDLQKERLRLEIGELRRPWHRRLNSWLSVTSAIIAVGALIGQNFLARAELANAEFDLKKKLADSIAQLSDSRAQLERAQREVGKLQGRIKSLQAAAQLEQDRGRVYIERNTKLRALLNRPDLSTADKAGLAHNVNGYYWIGVLGFGTPQERLNDINQFLSEQGYAVRFSYLLESRPQWLAGRPTVLYYSAQSEVKARTLATQLTERTHIRYNVSRGGGYDVAPQQREWIIYIHVV